MHKVVHYKVHRHTVGKFRQGSNNLFVGRAVVFQFGRVFHLDACAQADGLGVKHRAFAVGVFFLQLLQRGVQVVESSAHLVRKTYVQHILAFCKNRLDDVDIFLRIESHCFWHFAATDGFVKCVEVGVFAKVVVVLVATVTVGHLYTSDAQFFLSRVPKFAVCVYK